MSSKQKHPLDEKTRGGKVRSAAQRKLAKDGKTWTPTERLKRDQLMRQFMRTGRKGAQVSAGNSEAFREGYDQINWRKDWPPCPDCPHDLGCHTEFGGRCFMKGCDCEEKKKARDDWARFQKGFDAGK